MNTRYSIHILNHDFDPDPILDALTRQILLREEDIRVTLWDDFSSEEFQPILSNLQSRYTRSFISWKLERENVGRSAMRQKILNQPSDGWLLSIDSDMLPDDDFIDQMIVSLQNPSTVYAGRHYYQAGPPTAPYLLHWNYGRKREMSARDQDPYSHFSTGIFAIHSTLVSDLYFETGLTGYGHEDTLFGLLLRQKNIPVTRAFIKAVHLGLTQNDVFINRQIKAVENLREVVCRYPDYSSRLIKWGRIVSKIPILKSWMTSEGFRDFCRRRMEQNPSNMIYLDLLKLREILSGEFSRLR